jgi:hypothetical protein
MTAERPVVAKLRKVEAVRADRAATDGEKAAADAAATRIRAKRDRQRAEDARAAPKPGGDAMYLLGRGLRRFSSALRPDSARPDRGVMYALGRAWRKMTLK